MRDVAMTGWATKPLGEIAENLDSKRVPITKSQRESGDVPYYGASGVVDHVKDYLFDEPLLLVSEDGANLLARTYPIAFSVSGKTWVNNHAHVLRFGEAVTRRFVELYLNSISLEPYVSGMAQPKLNQKKLSGILVPLPPLKEQQRVVVILNEAFEGLARARTHSDANLQNARELLALTFEHELIKHRDVSIQTTIGEVCTGFEYGTSSKSQSKGKMPVLRMGNLQSGEIDWSDLVYTDSVADIEKLKLNDGDVLFNRTNSLEHVGKTAIYRGDMPAIFAGYLIRVHYDKSNMLPEFLNMFLNSKSARDYGRSISGKSVNQANISASKLKTYPIMLPPVRVQEDIVRKMESLRGPLKDLEGTYEAKMQDIDDLRQSLLQKAFAGELT